MTPSFVRKSTTLVLVVVSVALAACGGDVGSSRLKKTYSGMPRDSVLSVLGTGSVAATGNDSLRIVNGHHAQRFLINGQSIEVIWYSEKPGSVNDSIQQESETPVVLVADTLAGWGWKYLSEGGKQLGLQDPRPPKN